MSGRAAGRIEDVGAAGPTPVPPDARPDLDEESRRWVLDLGGTGPAHEAAVQRLHALLLRAAHFEVARRRAGFGARDRRQLDEIALEAADDALVSILARLGDFRGASRFTTWAYKFALLEAAVKVRRWSWQGRELPMEPESWEHVVTGAPGPSRQAEQNELLRTVQAGIAEVLTPHQRTVLVALALNGVPIDVLAERLGTTRGALYKTLHDARGKLRRHVAACGYDLTVGEEDS